MKKVFSEVNTLALSSVLMIAGIILIIISFFIKDSTKKLEKDVEELSISIFQETNGLKRRIKVVEEELMLEPEFQVKSPNNSKQKVQQILDSMQQTTAQPKQSNINQKPIHEIIINQVLELNRQGLSIHEIGIRSNLSEEQVKHVLATRGGR